MSIYFISKMFQMCLLIALLVGESFWDAHAKAQSTEEFLMSMCARVCSTDTYWLRLQSCSHYLNESIKPPSKLFIVLGNKRERHTHVSSRANNCGTRIIESRFLFSTWYFLCITSFLATFPLVFLLFSRFFSLLRSRARARARVSL